MIPPPHPQRGRGVIWFVRSPLLRLSPPPLPQRGEEGVGGKVRGIIPPSSPAAWGGGGWGEGEGYNPPPLPQRGRGGGQGGGEGDNPPSSPKAWERSDLVREIAPAPLIPPVLSHSVGEG